MYAHQHATADVLVVVFVHHAVSLELVLLVVCVKLVVHSYWFL